jgi:hypothetical protein
VDDTVVDVQVVEEWGYDMGDDACILVDDRVVEPTFPDLDGDQGDAETKNHVDKMVQYFADGVAGSALHQVRVAETDVTHPGSEGHVLGGLNETMLPRSKRARSCPPRDRPPALSGPWSWRWLQDHKQGEAGVTSSYRRKDLGSDCPGKSRQKKGHEGSKKRKGGGPLCHALFSLKRIARLPSEDRREVLHILHKNARKDKCQGGVRSSREETSGASAAEDSSTASATNDWQNWVAMQGDESRVAADVAEVGKSLGVFVKVEQANMFSVLSKAGKGKQSTQVGSKGGSV